MERASRGGLASQLVSQGLAVLILDCSMYLFWIFLGGFDAARVVPVPAVYWFIGGFPLVWLLLLGWLGRAQARSGLRHYMGSFSASSPLTWMIGDERVTGGDGGSFLKKLQRLFRDLPRRLRQQHIPAGLTLRSVRNGFISAAFSMLALLILLHFLLGVYFEFLVYAALLFYMLQDFRRKLDRQTCELALTRNLLGLDERGRPLPAEEEKSAATANNAEDQPSGTG